MKTLSFILVLMCAVACTPQTESNQIAATTANITAVSNHKETFTCGAETKSGTQCKKHVKEQGLKCYLHGGVSAETVATVQCEGTTKAGNRCKNKSKTAFCHLHSK